jgi:hypothetical protein
MRKQKRSSQPLDVKSYLKNFEGLEILPITCKPDEDNEGETIMLDKWVRHDFPEMGFTTYTDLDPP